MKDIIKKTAKAYLLPNLWKSVVSISLIIKEDKANLARL